MDPTEQCFQEVMADWFKLTYCDKIRIDSQYNYANKLSIDVLASDTTPYRSYIAGWTKCIIARIDETKIYVYLGKKRQIAEEYVIFYAASPTLFRDLRHYLKKHWLSPLGIYG